MIRAMMRAGVCVVALSLVVALAACGSASLDARAVSEARAVTLRAGDVSGFQAGHVATFHRFHTGPLLGKIERCDGGAPGPNGISAVRGQWLFGRQGSVLISLHSAVYVLASEAAALHEVAVLNGAKARSCIEHVERAVSPAHGGFRRLVAVALSSDLAPRSVALRVIGERRDPGSRTRYITDSDARGFALGQVLVMLYAQGLGGPAPAAVERHALSVLRSRAATRDT
jgi:hypothetical protein